jgi:hypothetical protein
MNKRFFFAIVLVVTVLMVELLMLPNRLAPEAVTKQVPSFSPTRLAVPPLAALQNQPAAEPAIETKPRATPQADSFQERILELWRQHRSPEEVAALLKTLHEEDPEHLFQALLALSKASLETRQTLVPLLAQSLTFWPDAEGRDVFPVADAYGDLDLPGAAQWAATFLATTERSDLDVASLLGQLAGTSESQALALIATLPDAARTAAANSVANHISLSDLNHLMAVSEQLDPNGSTSFSQLLFQRLAMERLNDTAAWLANTPAAQNLPGAASEIAHGLAMGDTQTAVTWADSLFNPTAQGQAIAGVYLESTIGKPDGAIQAILTTYLGTAQVLANLGTAGSQGSDLSADWNAANNLNNPSVRAYTFAALIEPMLLTSGLADTQAKVDALPPNSLERTVADIVLQSVLKKPAVAIQLQLGEHG